MEKRVVLGAMNFGKRTPKDESVRIIHRALERGVRWIDTANAYNDGKSEVIVGAAIQDRRSSVRVATKVGFARTEGRPEGLGRERVARAIDESLERLGTDFVDLYFLHVPDHGTPPAETLGAIGQLLSSGKIHAFGVSNYASWQILELMMTCGVLGIPRPSASQVLYNLLIRQLDLEYRAFTRAHPIHTTVYNPLAGGLLAGTVARGKDPAPGSRFDKNRLYLGRYFSERFFDLTEAYAALAREAGLSLLELAYGFVAGADFVDSVIVGPATVGQLDQALDALDKPLAPDVRKKVDELARAFAGTETSYAR
jgi:aryl-alcohol dehydrogenase-like predicted oxidoreductase